MRSSDLKYLSLGLGIGALLASLFFVGLFFMPQSRAPELISLLGFQGTPIPTITPTLQPASTATTAATQTFTPTTPPTSTPIPSPTATQTTTELMITSGEIVLSGPLTKEQQIKLYEASQFFIAPTYEQSKRMSVFINHAPFSDPSTTCGPLSIAILQKAGILNAEFDAHDFFLINPDLGKDQTTIKKFFPKENYINTRYKVRIDQFDWNTNPLMPGDFVYIYSGTGGNFEHMLVVNRVDAQGRTYSVTNYNTELGFVINEVLLFDPQDPNSGIFSTWTEKQFAELGSTGYAGFEVWRLIQ